MKTDTVKPSSLDDVLLSADVCYAEGDQTGAIEALDQAAKLSKRHPVILRALGTQLFLNGRHTWSRTVFEELTDAFPEEVDDHINYAIATFHDGDSDSCAAALQKALALDPLHKDALKLTADLDVKEGRYSEAKVKYELIAEKHGISVESLHALAYCQFKTGDILRSENTYQQLVEFNEEDELASHNLNMVRNAKEDTTTQKEEPENTGDSSEEKPTKTDAEKALEEADFFMQAGNSEGALTHLKQAVLLDGSSPALVEAYGSMLFSAGDYNSAREQFRKLIELCPGDVNAYIRLAMSCYEDGRIEEFECALGLAMEIDPENTALLHFWGKINLDEENYHDAGRIFVKLVELEPNNIDNLLALGKCLYHGKEIESATMVFERVLDLDPENEMAHKGLDLIASGPVPENEAAALETDEPNTAAVGNEVASTDPIEDCLKAADQALREENSAQAVEILSSALEVHPDDPQLINTLGSLYFNLGQTNDALELFVKKAELQPEDIENHLQVAGTAFVAERFGLFEKHLEKVLTKDPTNGHGMKLLASANFRSKNYKEAANLYYQLVDVFPEDTEIVLALGICFHQQGDNATAESCFKRTLEIDPYNEIASGNLEEMEKIKSSNQESNGVEVFCDSAGDAPEHDKTPLQAKPTPVPVAAGIGNLNIAQDLLGEKKYLESWNATLEAISLRPFHPEAYLHLAEIALCVNDEVQAKKCLEALVELTPKWTIAAQTLDSLKKQRKLSTSDFNWSDLPKRNTTPNISACLIVKDEERFLGQCLSSLKGVVNQIVVVDTGSTDRTIEIAGEHGAEVHHFDWCDDFSAARNFALEQARGDWVLIMDADEVLTSQGRNGLKHDTQQTDFLGCRVRCINMEPSGDGGYREMPDAWHFIPRLTRNAPGIHFVGTIHEQMFSSVLIRAEEWGMEGGFGKTEIDHYGYTEEIKKSRNKTERNISLIEKALEENPREPTLLMSYALDLFNRGEIETALDKLRESFDLVKEYPSNSLAPEVRERLICVFINLLLQAEMYDELIEVANSQLAKDCGPTSSILFMHALALVKSGRPAEAIEPLQECIAKQNDRTYTSPFKGSVGAPPFHLLADCLGRAGDLEGALEGYKAALEMDPESPGIRHDYAKLLAHQNRPEEAIELLNKAIQSDSMESRLWTLGCQIVNGHLHDIDIALRWTECAVEEVPNNPEIQKQRGIALITAGQFEEALPLFEQTPSHPLTDAARILCQITTDKKSDPTPVDSTQEVVVSSALVNWYRRFLERGLTKPAQKVTQRIESIEAVLPSAAKILKEAITEAD